MNQFLTLYAALVLASATVKVLGFFGQLFVQTWIMRKMIRQAQQKQGQQLAVQKAAQEAYEKAKKDALEAESK